MWRMSCIFGVLLLASVLAAAAPTTLDITVPESVKVEGEDSYICVTKPLPDKPLKLVGVEPLAEEKVVHHILLFGCDEPFVKPKPGEQAVWECKHHPTCGGRQDAVLYGWGRNAPKLELPPGVGYSIGKGSGVKWIVMQVHYLKEKPAADTAGVRLRVQDTAVPYTAGMLSYASYFQIPPHKKQHMVLNHCCYRGFQPLTTFAVRVHTHAMGRQVFMTRAPDTGVGSGDIVAKGDPLKPQGFNPITPKTLWPGQHLTVGCEFDSSDKDEVVMAGSDHNNEMCNMYLMVYGNTAHIEMCSQGASWVDDLAPGNIPHAATLARDKYSLWSPPQPTSKLNSSVVGNIASVTLGPDGTVWVLSRGGRVWGPDTFDEQQRITDTRPIEADVVMQLHPDTGKVLRQWGSGHFVMPHMIHVDRNNSVWVTDTGLHQALQFTASGELLREVGTKLTPGHDTQHLCKPTQVASLNDGSFLVSDGYCNSRVLRFNPDGSYHSEYKLPVKDGERNMAVVHSLVVDECDNEVFVADRENKAVHIFDLSAGNYKSSQNLASYGKVWALTKGPYGRTLALAWDQGKPAKLVDVTRSGSLIHWDLPESRKLWPHDMTLGVAPMPLTGAGERLLALYVAPLCESCGALEKYVLVPSDYTAPAADKAAEPLALPAKQRPPLAHLGGYHHHGHGPAPAAVQQQQQQEAKEEKEEAKVAAEEVQEDQQEAERLRDPKVIKELQQQVEELKKTVDKAARAAGVDSETFLSIHNQRGSGSERKPGVWTSVSGLLVLIVLCMVMGAVLGRWYTQRSTQPYGHLSTTEPRSER